MLDGYEKNRLYFQQETNSTSQNSVPASYFPTNFKTTRSVDRPNYRSVIIANKLKRTFKSQQISKVL